MARQDTRIGDIFSVEMDQGSKRYFQYVGNDLTQLNSDVIRAFKRIYPLNANPDLSEIVNGEVMFYAHCVTKLGLKMKVWEKVGNSPEIGNSTQVLFRDTYDYGSKEGEEPIRFSKKWHVWNINDDDFTYVGELIGEKRKAYIGLVFNPLGIVELLKGGKYPLSYPEFE